MGHFLIVSQAEGFEEYQKLSQEYQIGFELNDFFDPELLDQPEKLEERIRLYERAGVGKKDTMHGAFYDVTIFSNDTKIREISAKRMRQSMEIASRLGVKGVVFHTNVNPLLTGSFYLEPMIEKTASYLETLLGEFPDIEIYMENMFDSSPEVLRRLSERLCRFENYGVCLDYAHASLSSTKVEKWIEVLAPYIKHIHINDNDGKNDLHLALGDGKIDWLEFLSYYKKYFEECTILIETTQPKNQRKSLQFIENGWKKTQQTELENEDVSAGNPSNKEIVSLQEKEKLQGGDIRAEEVLEQIFHCMSSLIGEKDFEKTIQQLTSMGRLLVQADRASFWYWDREKKQYWTLAALGSERIVVPEKSGIVGASISENKVICINDPYSDCRFNPEVDRKSGYLTRSILCMPVMDAKGNVIGAYQAINKMNGRGEYVDFGQRDVDRLTLAAVYCGKTLESHMLYRAARVDQLTGLHNRRSFYEYCADVVHKELCHGMTSLIMCDIDHFKKVNDTYGHNAGDAVLVHISEILREQVGERGEVVRWGGEEFVLVLPGVCFEKAVRLAEAIRSFVEKSECLFEEEAICVTMSFGVSVFDGCVGAEENVKIVDGKLYQAKTTGRNRVIS